LGEKKKGRRFTQRADRYRSQTGDGLVEPGGRERELKRGNPERPFFSYLGNNADFRPDWTKLKNVRKAAHERKIPEVGKNGGEKGGPSIDRTGGGGKMPSIESLGK